MKIIPVDTPHDFPSPHYQVMGKEPEALAVAKELGAKTIYRYDDPVLEITTWAIPEEKEE